MKHALLIFTAFIALAYGTSAQEQPKPPAPVTCPTTATLLQLKIEGAALTQLALAEAQLDSARNAYQAAELSYELRKRQLLESLGGSSLDYDTTPQRIGQGLAYVPKVKK